MGFYWIKLHALTLATCSYALLVHVASFLLSSTTAIIACSTNTMWWRTGYKTNVHVHTIHKVRADLFQESQNNSIVVPQHHIYTQQLMISDWYMEIYSCRYHMYCSIFCDELSNKFVLAPCSEKKSSSLEGLWTFGRLFSELWLLSQKPVIVSSTQNTNNKLSQHRAIIVCFSLT